MFFKNILFARILIKFDQNPALCYRNCKYNPY